VGFARLPPTFTPIPPQPRPHLSTRSWPPPPLLLLQEYADFLKQVESDAAAAAQQAAAEEEEEAEGRLEREDFEQL
jgi:hypothetical protein